MNNIIKKYLSEIESAITIRMVENKLLELFSKGKLNGTVHTTVGQEFSGVFISKYLNEDDFIVSNHRGHGHYLAAKKNIKGLIAEIMGKTEGLSGGFGGSQHLADHNFLTNGIQGGMVPTAAGVGLFNKNISSSSISVAYIGDGTLGEGILYETMNLASMLEIPLLIVLENNGFAQSTSHKQTFKGNLFKIIEGFGLNYFKTNTWDIDDLNENCSNAIEFVRKNSLPALIEIETYRLNSHSKGDDNRISEEILKFQEKDVLTKILNFNNSLIDDFKKDLSDRIDKYLNELELSEDLIEQKINTKLEENPLGKNSKSPYIQENDRYNNLIYRALKEVFENNSQTIMFGEDIQNLSKYTDKPYGGAFKVTKDLSDLFPNRILNMPISEAAFTGLAAGYSLKAGRTLVEIMFGDFSTLIFDQVLQHISKFEIMYNGKYSCPIIIRCPMGGKRGYGPTHSQSIEKHFLGINNFNVVVLNHRLCPSYIYSKICEIDNSPFMVIENKILYTIDTAKKTLPSYSYKFDSKKFPDLIISPVQDEPIVTIICYGEVLNEVEDAAFELLVENDIYVEIICPSLISSFYVENIVSSLSKTRRLIVVEEGSGIASWGSEIISELVATGREDLSITRLSNNLMIPSSFKAEISQIPEKFKIKNHIIKLISNV
jgi:2-oxoisovalerate dehydrogenase E1 component